MLVDIFARTMLHATSHSDLPVRPLPQPYQAPPRRPGVLGRMIRSLAQSRLRAKETLAATPATGAPCGSPPALCK
ncbi:hypothetical protein [Tritonibacter horizontis]|uniref:Uncharacterized protein n=1 Tax=Tritonibacter horizontis TaxID=1768241 RepID=A0A132BT23_9RHOB|nr:hypothetical protein [Tritonibacter horizontis]KUP91172.1 hypothetical protein TRIHO_39500 [Tritonibacter horizontis]